MSTQRDRTVDPDAAIKVLKSFVPQEEWLLEPGDMLYAPPGVAHFGVTEGPCVTYSIGFLAPSHQALVQGFLGYLGEVLTDEIDADARYADPDLRTQKEPLALGDAMVAQVAAVLERIRWDKGQTDEFLGRYLTGRQSPSTFAAPARPLDEAAFARKLRGRGRLELALASRGLTRGNRLFLNGEAHAAKPAMLQLFKQLVLDRCLPLPIKVDAQTLALLHDWYAAGYLRLV